MILALALTLAAMAFVLFVRPSDVPEAIPVSPTQHLEDRKRAIYDNLRDLQFEYRLGKLSDADYQQTKLALQKELAGVLSEMDSIVRRLGLARPEATPNAVPVARVSATSCPHCGANFPKPLKFCGECGKAMA
jgi:rRNA maturation endonuclease Nob1